MDKNKSDFESQWQDKFSRAVAELAGEPAREQVLAGGEGLSDSSSARDRLAWSRQALEILAGKADERTRREILTRCACQYPAQDLRDVKSDYQQNRDLDRALALLREKFERFLRESLDLTDELVQTILERGWGLAGVRDGNRVIATKIPKSGSLREYFQEQDPLRRRQLYCHCPRVRDALGTEPGLPVDYCCCGAGFYRGIWEEILGQPVVVEVLESVLAGGEVCRIAVQMPE